ncbi:unnamed protein product, partial [Coregonus sp. 'balchen']
MRGIENQDKKDEVKKNSTCFAHLWVETEDRVFCSPVGGGRRRSVLLTCGWRQKIECFAHLWVDAEDRVFCSPVGGGRRQSVLLTCGWRQKTECFAHLWVDAEDRVFCSPVGGRRRQSVLLTCGWRQKTECFAHLWEETEDRVFCSPVGGDRRQSVLLTCGWRQKTEYFVHLWEEAEDKYFAHLWVEAEDRVFCSPVGGGRRQSVLLTCGWRQKTEYFAHLSASTTLLPSQVLRKEAQQLEPRGMWDVLRKGASQALFSDLENMDENMTDTTLLVHFFGKKGKAEFMDNLQTEVLEIEFLSYSKGLPIISEEDFAHILLRFTNVDDIAGYLDNVRKSITDEKGITFDEFRSFFQFMNNLEDFAIAMQMYNFANRSIGQDELARAVYVTTGLKLTDHLVNTVFHIFDEDRDGQLSYKEFIGVMKDRLQPPHGKERGRQGGRGVGEGGREGKEEARRGGKGREGKEEAGREGEGRVRAGGRERGEGKEEAGRGRGREGKEEAGREGGREGKGEGPEGGKGAGRIFARAVYVTTGGKLTDHLVNTDRDGQLIYKEFIGVMKDRLAPPT